MEYTEASTFPIRRSADRATSVPSSTSTQFERIASRARRHQSPQFGLRCRIRRRGPNGDGVWYFEVDEARSSSRTRVFPFFERYPASTRRRRDLAIFRQIHRDRPVNARASTCQSMASIEFSQCLRPMNRAEAISRKPREAGSSETARQAHSTPRHGRNAEDTVRSSWRHGESGRNDLTTSDGDMPFDGVTTCLR